MTRDSGTRTELPDPQIDHDFLDTRDPVIDWQTAQEYGLFSMAADLVRDHVARLRAGGAVTRLDDYRASRFVNRERS